MGTQVITAFGIGRVIRSKDSNYKEGDVVLNRASPVAEYCVVPSQLLRKLDPNSGLALPEYLSALGGFIIYLFTEAILVES